MMLRRDRAALPQSCRKGLRHNKSLRKTKLRYLPPCRSRFARVSCVSKGREPQHMVYMKGRDSPELLVCQ